MIYTVYSMQLYDSWEEEFMIGGRGFAGVLIHIYVDTKSRDCAYCAALPLRGLYLLPGSVKITGPAAD